MWLVLISPSRFNLMLLIVYLMLVIVYLVNLFVYLSVYLSIDRSIDPPYLSVSVCVCVWGSDKILPPRHIMISALA